nr:MAG TPA: hypothetical protein [Caudoviricetes sp.]
MLFHSVQYIVSLNPIELIHSTLFVENLLLLYSNIC